MAFATLASSARGLASLTARLIGAHGAAGCCAAILACGATGAEPAAVYDSGWSVASPTLPTASAAPGIPLGPSRVPADRFVGPRTLEKLHLPAREPADDSNLKWRSARTARRPGAGPQHDGVLPPLPLDGQEPATAAPAAQEPRAPQPIAQQPTAQQPSGLPEGPSLVEPKRLTPVETTPRLDNAFSVPDVADSEAAPEMQALPEEPATPPAGRKPAPFAAAAAKPIGAEPAEPKPITPDIEGNESRLTKPGDDQAPAAEADPQEDASQDGVSSDSAPQDDQPDVVIEDRGQPKKAAPRAADDPDTRSSQNDEEKPGAEAQRNAAAGEATRRNSRTFVTPKEVEKPKRPLKPLSRNQMNLRSRLRSVLAYYYRRPLNSVDHDSWEVMHSMLSYGLYSRVQDGGRRGKPVTAVGYLCFNKPCNRYRMLYLTPEGNLDCRVGVGMQGHKGQLLAMLAQCDVSPDYPIRVEGKDFTIRDLIAAEQLTCYSRTELTFKLIGLMHYLPSDSTWVNDRGEEWDFAKLIADERTQKIRGAACGGTHRLGGLALAAKKRVARGEPLDGEWAEAAKFVEEHQKYAFRLQNRDGSLSTEWFRGPGDEDDIDRRIRTTGHLLEWLIYSLPEEQLTDSRIFRAVNYLSSLIASNTDNAWEIGPLAHALHALKLYDERVFEPYDDPNGPRVAGRTNRPVKLNYKSLTSGVSESYYYVQERHEERENRGLGGLFGFGNSSRRSR